MVPSFFWYLEILKKFLVKMGEKKFLPKCRLDLWFNESTDLEKLGTDSSKFHWLSESGLLKFPNALVRAVFFFFCGRSPFSLLFNVFFSKARHNVERETTNLVKIVQNDHFPGTSKLKKYSTDHTEIFRNIQ